MSEQDETVRTAHMLIVGCLMVVAFLGGILAATLQHISDPERTCESVDREQFAFRQCMELRPHCESIGVEDFVVYYENKDWLDANCPTHSGDGYLSQ
jgi:hypothetical protein